VQVEVHPEAVAELRSAAIWYGQRRAGLGEEFLTDVATALSRIGKAAGSFPIWPGTHAGVSPIRRATLQRFPYVIAFQIRRETVLVLAVAHGKRRPLYWLARAER
jgi:toxin ParE1/3/4